MSSHKNTKYNKESFINIAKDIHNDKFNYDNINYTSGVEKVLALKRYFLIGNYLRNILL